MSGIIIPDLSPEINPGEDFYWHVNKTWETTVNIPSWSSSYGVSEEIEMQIEKVLYRILKKCKTIKSNDCNALSIFTTSALTPSYQKNSVLLLKQILNSINCIRDTDDIARTLAEFCLYKCECLITVYTVEQEEEHHKNRIYLATGKLGLPDKSYYDKSSDVILPYTKMLTSIAKLLEFPDPKSVEVFVQEEVSLAYNMDRADFEKDSASSIKHLETLCPAIPWASFWSVLNIKNDAKIILGSKRWLKIVNILFKKWSLDNWKIFLKCSLILHALPVLPKPFSKYYFNFFGRLMSGQKEKIPTKRLALTMTQKWLTVSLSKEYIKALLVIEPGIKAEVTEFVKKLVESAKSRLSKTDWLEHDTRLRAKKKLGAMHLGVGYPDEWPDIELPELNKENFLGNILELGKSSTIADLNNEGKVSKKIKCWDDPAFAVNAFYYSSGNGLIMPAGILIWPFYKKDAPLGWNYGALGAAIGHEMTHAFDMDGKNYDERGFLEPWWTVSDNRNYNKKTKELIKIFNEAEYVRHHVNGELTLSENISDLGGLGIALGALEGELDRTNRIRGLRNFFIAFAVSWRTKMRLAKAYQSLLVDRHAPPTLRVNLIVSQFDQWYEAFDIQPGHKLYREPAARIRIF